MTPDGQNAWARLPGKSDTCVGFASRLSRATAINLSAVRGPFPLEPIFYFASQIATTMAAMPMITLAIPAYPAIFAHWNVPV
jgi:hypothetical protein